MRDLTEGNEFKTILCFSLPILIGNLFQQLYNVTDSVVVGNYLGKNALASVGFCYQINVLMTAVSMGTTLGTSIMISRYFGEGKKENAKRTADSGFLFSLVLSIIFTVLGICFSGNILSFFRIPGSIFNSAKTYFKIIFIGVIPSFAYNTITNILRGTGDSKTPTYVLIISALLNTVLDIVFVAFLNLGVAGAAAATVIAQGFSFIFCMIYMKIKYPDLYIDIRHLHFDFDELKKSLLIGIPAMLQQVFISIGFMSIQVLINIFGTECMAAYTAASKIDSFAEMPALNLGKAVINYTAQNLGAGKTKRVKKGTRDALALAIIISAVISIIIIAFPDCFIKIFIKDDNVIKIGNEYLRIVSSFYFIFASMQIINGILLGYGRSFVPMLASVLSLCLFQVPIAVFLSKTVLGYRGIWIASPIGWTGGLIIRTAYWKFIVKKENTLKT